MFKKMSMFEKTVSMKMVKAIVALVSLASLVLSSGSYLTWR